MRGGWWFFVAGLAWTLALQPCQAARKDPTRPYPAERWNQVPGTWRFVATQISRDGRRALIDGRWVRVGDRVGGFHVRAIRHGEVILQGFGRSWVVRLAPVPGIRERSRRP